MTKYRVERVQEILLNEDDFKLAGLGPSIVNAETLAREFDEWTTVDVTAEPV